MPGPHLTAAARHGEIVRPAPGTGYVTSLITLLTLSDSSIKLTFQDSKGNDIKTIEGNEGDDILSLAHEYDVDLEGKSFVMPI